MTDADRDDLIDNLAIMLDLPRFGEVIAHVAFAFAATREMKPPTDEELRELAISTWKHVCFMADREEFKASASRDIEQLTAPTGPEYGFFEPPL